MTSRLLYFHDKGTWLSELYDTMLHEANHIRPIQSKHSNKTRTSILQISPSLATRQESVKCLEDLHYDRLISVPVVGVQGETLDVPALACVADRLIL